MSDYIIIVNIALSLSYARGLLATDPVFSQVFSISKNYYFIHSPWMYKVQNIHKSIKAQYFAIMCTWKLAVVNIIKMHSLRF